MWKTAQRLTKKPVKFGTIGPELVAFAVADRHYKNVKDRILAIADALNEELHELADAGCPVIQFEEPQIHLLAVRNIVDAVINPAVQRRGVQPHGEGPARQDRGVVPHLLGQSVAAAHVRAGAELQAALELLNKVDADVITFESAAPAAWTSRPSARSITGQEDRHRRDRPSHPAGRAAGGDRRAYPPRAQVHSGRAAGASSSDCGMGREGMSRRHAFYKMVVAGAAAPTSCARELGLPEAECLAADPRYSLVVPAK